MATPTLPIDLAKWISDNPDKLQPPVNNYCMWNADLVVMVVGGPNARTDYHVNPTAEWFYQYKGDMLLKLVHAKTFTTLPIRQGEMFLLPPGTPHNPVRFANTIGIVIEQRRPQGKLDALQWYCEKCSHIVYRESFHCVSLGTQLKPVIEKWANDSTIRQCKTCGHVNPVKEPLSPVVPKL
ncbi:3-hydroxyanthranilate 3,4-dioxygenase [Synchytrium endobioticum]|uniref:3-hydroxyanthranilate 3,4-dioxygenase n=1 Tax=Synchytrium endobioticum TaxID=286115 RepID=A0A507CVC7_9FUNG|nr:3-hydroxyanthranilate 3,4-dioxygenase [Synchytrium endobioticum]TPX42850.1 3-hydroxyanthranilate 3,4-dioxygenase [Synchytrium endobioticum]